MNRISISLNCAGYASKWTLTDFYLPCEAKLREALTSGYDFDTTWECRKEDRSCWLLRTNDAVRVHIESRMDDLYDCDDLIYDALFARLHLEEELPEETIEAIKDHCYDLDLLDSSMASAILPREATFEEIINAISSCETEAEEINSITFKTVCDIVEQHYKELRGQDQP